MKAVKWLKKKSFGGYERVPLIKEEVGNVSEKKEEVWHSTMVFNT